MEVRIVVKAMQGLKADTSGGGFVEALQDNRSVRPYRDTTNTTNLVAQHGLQISGILADDFPAVEERIL